MLDVEQGAVGRHEEAQVLQGVQESDREGDDGAVVAEREADRSGDEQD